MPLSKPPVQRRCSRTRRFVSLPNTLPGRSASGSAPPSGVPEDGSLNALARSRLVPHNPGVHPHLCSPLRQTARTGSWRANRTGHRKARPTNLPDLRSLPGGLHAITGSSPDQCSRSATFPSACCFLKPPATSSILLQNLSRVNLLGVCDLRVEDLPKCRPIERIRA